ncbi:helix-turn-helix domain-containing protein [Streptomyces rubiginosohelvolus]|uniref:helix-turn-helix domain-containing protein n=1 Tax=Streptomyces rubiginosohelvolus TaxID=67362 RepID=UPI0036CD8E83
MLSEWLRAERRRANLTYAQMAAKVKPSAATLSRATSGKMVPAMYVVIYFARACGADENTAAHLWQRANEDWIRSGGYPDLPPAPELITDEAELWLAMRYLKAVSGLSIRAIEHRSRQLAESKGGGYWLPRSTLGNALSGQVSVSKQVLTHFIAACGVREESRAVWQQAWERALGKKRRRSNFYANLPDAYKLD